MTHDRMQYVELRHLRYFTAVAENGGFGRAAQLLHVAQSAISEQIRDLESELGAALFDRNNRTIRLTREGELFLIDARAVLASADKAAANVQKSLHGEIGKLTIGFFVGGTGKFFPAIIKEFRLRFPQVQVAVGGDGARHATPGIASGLHRHRVYPRSCNRRKQRHFARNIFLPTGSMWSYPEATRWQRGERFRCANSLGNALS